MFDATQSLLRDTNPCNASGGSGHYGMYAPSVSAASYAQTTAPAGTVMVAPAANTASSIVALMNKRPYEATGIIPAGNGGVGYEDRPITYAARRRAGGGGVGNGGGYRGQSRLP